MQLKLTLGDGPLYSLDTSALIDVKDLYPIEVFPSMWQFIGRLAEAQRVFVAEAVKEECYDEEIIEILKAYPNMIVEFGLLQEHFAALMAEAEEKELLLVDPSTVRNAADPHVIAVALMLEVRDTLNLATPVPGAPECLVVSHEHRRNPGARLAKIPDVCDFYGLEHVSWLDLLRRELFSV